MKKNNQFYKILCLKNNKQIFINKTKINIKFDNIIENKIIFNDKEFNLNISKNNFFYISGGGSFIFQNRYLLLTQRSNNTIINKNKLSLFTGRADNNDEWKKPSLIIRELFEEINLIKDNIPVYFINEKFQNSINKYQKYRAISNRSKVKIEYMNISNYEIEILENNISLFKDRSLIHISKNNDINLLYFFNINIDPLTFKYESIEDNKISGRPIYFLDLKNTEKIFYLNNNKFIEVNEHFECTEHCLFSINLLSKHIHK